MHARLSTIVLLVGLVAIAASACGKSPPAKAATEQFESRGRIASISAKSIDIQHERMPAIRTFDGTLAPMESMVMSFSTDGVSASGLAQGDLVSFAFTVHYDAEPTLRLTRIAKLPPDTRLTLP